MYEKNQYRKRSNKRRNSRDRSYLIVNEPPHLHSTAYCALVQLHLQQRQTLLRHF